MAKPTLVDLDSQEQDWEVTLNDDLGVLRDGPMPIYENAATSLAALETAKPAANFARCLCWFNDSTLGWTLAQSDGTSWAIIGVRAADVGALSFTTLTDTPATADALRDELQNTVLPEFQTAINAIRTALRNAGLMA